MNKRVMIRFLFMAVVGLWFDIGKITKIIEIIIDIEID